MILRRNEPFARVACILALALSAAGCGSDSRAADRTAMERVVNEFAAAHDQSACGFLTAKAMADLYGSGSQARGRAGCIAASKHFTGGAVSVEQVKFSNAGAPPQVLARNKQTGRHYTVAFAKVGGVWKIDRITSP